MKTLLVALLLSLTLGASAYASSGGGGGGGSKGSSNYQEIKPPFVVNLPDSRQLHFMQIAVAVSAKSEEALKALELHMPLIRNNLIMLFSGQSKEIVNTREGREKLRADAEDTVRKSLLEVGAPSIDALYFTSLVVQ